VRADGNEARRRGDFAPAWRDRGVSAGVHRRSRDARVAVARAMLFFSGEVAMLSARSVEVFLGIWLMLSVGVWPHEAAQHTSSLLVGAIVTGVAFVAAVIPKVRWVNVALGAWLVASIWVLPTMRTDTRWNTLLVGLGLMALAFIPNSMPSHFLDEKEA
jgi:hypothetical protein